MYEKWIGRKAIDNKGNEISIGDKIQSFRGEKAILTGLTRTGTIYKSGLVCVEWLDENGKKTGRIGEYYDKVFNIKVIDIYENDF